MSNCSVLTVSQLNRYVKSVLDGDFRLRDLYLKGEISNFTAHYKSGHLYFTLKEGGSAVKAVMFSSSAQRLRFEPENGMAVVLRCSVSLYERDGSYQIYVTEMQPEGKGDLQIAFEQLYRKLEAQGYFARERKRPIPRFPERIGIITSPTGAAVQDILTILNRRYPIVQILFYPALVQGQSAQDSLIGGLQELNRRGDCDVIIIGRGGGSIEDLWAFNGERLVQAVADSKIPVISAVGHETDYTLCDYAADLRAPTPSAAAELAVPNLDDVRFTVLSLEEKIEAGVQRTLTQCRRELTRVSSRECFRNPGRSLDNHKKKVEYFAKSIQTSVKNGIMMKREQLRSRAARLEALNPVARFAAGYSITSSGEGRILKTVQQVRPGDEIMTRLADGSIRSTVLEIITDKENAVSKK